MPTTTPATPVLYVRLRPRSGKKNAAKFPMRYTIAGLRFEAERGWYRLTDLAFAKRLKKIRLHEEDPDSPRIFDVYDEATALDIQAKERRSKSRRDVEDADTLTARDVSPKRARSRDVTSADAAPRPSKEETDEDADEDDDADEQAMIDPDPDGEDLADDDAGELEAVGMIGDDDAAPDEPKPATAKPRAAKKETKKAAAGTKPRRARSAE